MIKYIPPQFFLSFFYLLTAFVILDFTILLLKPLFHGYHILYFWDFTFRSNPLFFLIFFITLTSVIVLRSPNKSFLQMVYNKEKPKASYYGICVFSILFFGMMFLIIAPYVSDIIYDYRNSQCLDSFWYCFNYFK